MCLTLLEWILGAGLVFMIVLWHYTRKLAMKLSNTVYERGYEAGRNSEKRDRFNLGQTVKAMRAAQSFDVIMQDEDLAIAGTEARRIKEAFEEAVKEKRDNE